MIMESNTNCKNVCATHATITIGSPLLIAAGSEISAIAANIYAHHIVLTKLVILVATF
jgi:uncharacterized protein (DUF2345 family)